MEVMSVTSLLFGVVVLAIPAAAILWVVDRIWTRP
jgi:hypothetical protein